LYQPPAILNLMNTKSLVLGVGAVVVVLGMWLMGSYNSLATQSAAIDGQWAQVETQYQRRFDLIPNLVGATKGVLAQEQEVFEGIAKARTGYAGASNPSLRAEAAGQLESALSRLLVIVENYPQLKSNETVQDLMVELAGTENRISVERGRYNEKVLSYNTMLVRFPGALLGQLFGFSTRPYFQAEDSAETAPKVDLSIEKK
jgi:LemA protein